MSDLVEEEGKKSVINVAVNFFEIILCAKMSAHFAALTWCWSCSSRWTPEWAADTSPVRRRERKLQNNISTSSPPWWARAPPGWMRCTLRLRGGTAVCVHAENKITTEKQKDLQIISRSSAFGPNKLRSEHLHTQKTEKKRRAHGWFIQGAAR